jgi:orotate phosphoribosyltransferase
MIKKDEASVKVAEFLLQIKAIKLEPTKPFTWASGWKSPIYCDNRIALSYPKIRTYIRQQLVKCIEDNYGKPDVIAGVATAAIAQGVLVAEAMGLPFVYVRSSPKEHGRANQIEGEIKEGQKVVVIEDLISTGQSSLKAVEALRAAGCDVIGMVSIFTYGFNIATENFANANCPIHTLSNYDTLIHIAKEGGYIIENDTKTLKSWRESPDTWGK